MSRRRSLTALVAAGAMFVLMAGPVVAGGNSIIREVEHVGPDAGILEVVPSAVVLSSVDGSVTVTGTLECPAAASSLGVVVTVTQANRGRLVQGESWDSIVQCGGTVRATSLAIAGERFVAGPAMIRIGAFVCDLHCGADFIDATVVLVSAGNSVGGRRK